MKDKTGFDNPPQDNERKVAKDMVEIYHEKLSRIQEEIDDYKQQLSVNRLMINNLKERMAALFVFLSPKMTEPEKQKQFLYDKEISKIKIFRYVKRDMDGVIQTILAYDQQSFMKVKKLLELREMHINAILEKLNLTAMKKQGHRRVQ